MNRLLRRAAYLVCVLLISSCSWISSDDDGGDNGLTLADLEPAVIPEKNTELPKVEISTLIEIYNDVLSVTTEPEMQIQVLQRLAGLEIKRGEQQELLDAEQSGQFDLAISAYKRLLQKSPYHEKSDQLMYQLSKAYDLSGQLDKSMAVLDDLVKKHPNSIYYAEAQFRRAEIFFTEPDYKQAELAYAEVIKQGETTVHYKNALYMHGWTLFKQQRYRASLRSFIGVLDLNIRKGSRAENLRRGDRELTYDVLRVMSVVFSYLDGPTTINEVFANLGERHYLPTVYAQLGELYLKKERYRDSAETYRAFIDKYPTHDEAPLFYANVIEAYLSGAFSDEVLQEKEKYVDYYGISSDSWTQKTVQVRNYIRPYLKQYLPELARHYHAKAQAGAKQLAAGGARAKKSRGTENVETPATVKEKYLRAGDYYMEFVDTFPADVQVPEMQFLLAESRFEAGDYSTAVNAYEVVAYRYTGHKRGAESGYGAIVAHGKLLEQLNQTKPVDKEKVDTSVRLKIASQLRFAKTFFTDKRADSVLAKSAEELLQLSEYRQALEAAQQLVRKQPSATKALRKTGWLVIGLSQFELGQYDQSEVAYKETLKLLPAKDPTRKDIVERLAATVYKQGEAAMNTGNQVAAADQFLRVASVAPGSPISVTAQFDAANAYLATSSWAQAIDVLNRFRRTYPNDKLSADIPAKLVVAYQNSGQLTKAADELTNIYEQTNDEGIKRESLYQAAELYEKSGDINSAIDRYRSYAHGFADPFPIAMEARYKLSELYLSQKQDSKRRFWLKKMIAADASAGSKRTDRSRYLGAFSSTVFANDHYDAFRAIPLKLPLKKSLKRKKAALNKALKSYQSVTKYGVQEFATLATYRIASIYQQLSADLLSSERPKGLDELALEEYGILLEEQAFPFEEKSISIHETNAQRSWQGTYDDWVKESFNSLEKLLPARYGKNEGGITFDNEIY